MNDATRSSLVATRQPYWIVAVKTWVACDPRCTSKARVCPRFLAPSSSVRRLHGVRVWFAWLPSQNRRSTTNRPSPTSSGRASRALRFDPRSAPPLLVTMTTRRSSSRAACAPRPLRRRSRNARASDRGPRACSLPLPSTDRASSNVRRARRSRHAPFSARRCATRGRISARSRMPLRRRSSLRTCRSSVRRSALSRSRSTSRRSRGARRSPRAARAGRDRRSRCAIRADRARICVFGPGRRGRRAGDAHHAARPRDRGADDRRRALDAERRIDARRSSAGCGARARRHRRPAGAAARATRRRSCHRARLRTTPRHPHSAFAARGDAEVRAAVEIGAPRRRSRVGSRARAARSRASVAVTSKARADARPTTRHWRAQTASRSRRGGGTAPPAVACRCTRSPS